ncbi:MAG: DNA repair protein RecN [Planctomycetota bacterium]
MLVELQIEDLALIERATLTFEGGFGVITGETGAGKSLLIDALELLLGGRSRTGLVRQGAARARVEGRFLVDPEGYGTEVVGWLQERLPSALEDWTEDGREGELELILTRTIGIEKRGQAHVNHRPVTQSMLRELAALLVEIHGQNDQQRLFEASEQLRLLDAFGGLEDQFDGYRERRENWLGLATRLDGFAAQEAQRLQRIDLLAFQIDELQEAEEAARDGEALLAERSMLRHAGGLGRDLGGVQAALYEDDGNASERLQAAIKVLEGWVNKVAALQGPVEALREAQAYMEDAGHQMARILSDVEGDPARLEYLEEVLAGLERLQRKFGTNAEGLLQRLDDLRQEKGELDAAEAGEEALAEEVRKALTGLAQAASRLQKERRSAATRLCQSVQASLGELGLGGARFDVAWEKASEGSGTALERERRRFGPRGEATVEFLLSANPGEPLAPLRQVASGGEMARVMLALRGALAVKRTTPTLIFDEVDTGVGGRLGPEVGSHLARLAEHHQVLCVTHLPAIAARAHGHLKVEKEVRDGRTHTRVIPLKGKDREVEIADMIAGGKDQASARAEARRLLKQK